MSRDPSNPFDDPALKAALKRVAGGETAPAALRDRVRRALAAEAGGAAAGAPSSARPAPRRAFDWRHSPLVGLAAAAMIIVSFAFIYRQGLSDFLGGEKFVVPEVFYKDMIAAHTGALALASQHELDVPKDDLGAIRQTLRDKLGHPVLVASLGPEWTLQGARVATVGTTPASQLVFSNGRDSVSVFSFSGRAYYETQDGREYRTTVDGHPVAGVVKGGTVHCIVGSQGSALSEKDLARIRNRIADEVSPAPPATSLSNLGCGSGGPPQRMMTAGM